MAQQASLQTGSDPREARGSARGRAMLWLLYGILVITTLVAGWWGLGLRRTLYTWSDPIRFSGDVSSAWTWGKMASNEGVVALYDRLDREVHDGPRRDYGLEYPPVRTWLLGRWAAWTQKHFPDAKAWQRQYEFSAPMLWGNNIAEMLSALGVFLIVRRQVLRGQPDAVALPTPGVRAKAAATGFVGAMLLWFNAGVLFDAHCFPQWDMWGMPMFLFAVLAGMHGRFFTAGLLVGLGALIKAQILWAAPVLLLWPLLAGKWRGAFALVMGIVAAVAALTWAWLVHGLTAHLVVIGVGLLTLLPVVHWRRWRWAFVPFGMMGMAVLACGLWNGSFSWFRIGFVAGAMQHAQLSSGGTSNLCTILRDQFAFDLPTTQVRLPWGVVLELRTLLAGVVGVCLLICGWGAAVHFRRRDARFLVAIAAPFVLFYALMPQMQDRYLVWGAAATALMAGVGSGMVVLHLAITFIMWAAVATTLYGQKPGFSPEMLQLLTGLHGGIGWALLVLAGVMLCQASPLGSRSPMAVSDASAR